MGRAEDILSQAQFAYMAENSTINAVFVFHTILSTSLESSNGTYYSFIDFTKAFDNINREALFKKLKQLSYQRNTSKND